MKKSIITLTAMALGLAFLPLADSAFAQPLPGPNNFLPGAVSSEPEVPLPVVCFYTAPNFKGLYFCESGTRTVSTVPVRWRNKIESIAVSDHAVVRVCPANVLQGNCSMIGGDIIKLEPGLLDHVYSYAIKQVY